MAPSSSASSISAQGWEWLLRCFVAPSGTSAGAADAGPLGYDAIVGDEAIQVVELVVAHREHQMSLHPTQRDCDRRRFSTLPPRR